MATRVDVNPEVLAWAIHRADTDPETLSARKPLARLDRWLAPDRGPNDLPTFRQLEDFAKATHAPIGYLLLNEPPDEPMPVPDFRRRGATTGARPSANLLDAIYLCERRQDWFRRYAERTGRQRLSFVGSLTTRTSPEEAAALMRDPLGLTLATRTQYSTWTDALRGTIAHAEALGVLVMVSGIVGSNTHRVLDPDEFGGFSLADPLAPVVFVNGQDSKAAQFFTLAHELAHIWLGQTGVSDAQVFRAVDDPVERWCNAVAAELLVPVDDLRREFHATDDLAGELQRLVRRYRVSTLVVLRRAQDAGLLTWDAYRAAYDAELERIRSLDQKGAGGGDFYNTLPVRTSRSFASAVVTSALEGETPYREAYRLLGFRKASTFDNLRDRLGVG